LTGKFLNRARRHAKKYVTRSGWQEDIILESADGMYRINTVGFVSKHWINFDTDGNAANSKNAHICLDEDLLIAASYPVRNSDQEVFLRKHKVITKDSTGIEKNYVVNEWFPDETLGLIVCILGDYDTTNC